MNASLAQRNDYQVKCYELNLAQLSGRLQWRRDDDDDEKQRWVHQKKAQKTRPNRFLEAEPNPKSRTYVADRTPAKEPNLRKREGKALTSPGNPLTNLTIIKLSRKKVQKFQAERVWKVCFARFIQSSIYPPLPNPQTMHLTCTSSRGGVCCAHLKWIWSGGLVWQ